jgi:flagellar assembly factor FliW
MSVATMESVQTTQMPIICFSTPMPGFPDDRHYVLERIDETGLLFEMMSLETPGLRFLVIPPAPFFPNYEPEIDDETVAELGNTSAEHLTMLLIVTVGDQVRNSTVNLLAPIVIDHETRKGKQIVLDASDLSVRQRLERA